MRKSLLRVLLTACILLLVCSLCTAAAYADEGTITGSDVNLRSGPGYTYDIIACMPRGAVVTINDRSNPSWTAVTFNGRAGFVSAGYVSASTPAASTVSTVPSSASQTGTINGSYVNFRTGPSASAAIQGVLNNGTAVTVLSEVNGWTNISVNGVTGYVSSNFVSRSGNTVIPAVTAAPVVVPVVTAAPVSGSGEATINADGVNLRSGPSSGYEILGAFDRGTSVTVLSEANGWSRVSINGHEGYMFSRYITRNAAVVPAATAAPVVTPTVPTVVAGGSGATINADGVNLRSGPGSNYSTPGSFNRGTPVTAGAAVNGWTPVVINGVSGYVYSSYVTGAPAATPAPTPVPTPEPTPAPVVTPAPDGTNATLNDDYVYLWSRPTNRSDVRGSFDKGTRIIVQSESDGWTYVLINGYPGYVHSEYVTLDNAPVVTPAPTAAPAATAAPAGGSQLDSSSGIINANGVNFRESASTYSAIRGCFDKGTVVTVTGTSGSWTACTVNGVSGYVYSSYVTRSTAQSATPTEAPTAVERTGIINADYVHHRSGPSSSNTILGTYSTGKTLTITGRSGDWTACTIDGISGYVFSQYVTETTPTSAQPTPTPTPTVTPAATDSSAGYITGTSVNFRSGPSTDSQILGTYNSGKSVSVLGQSNGWTACSIDGVIGYVYSSYVRSGTITVSGNSSELGNQIAQYALQFVGYRYVWAGTSPATGFDCSGLVQYVYSHFNYSLPRVANDQATCGIAVSRAELQPGDLLGFYSGGSYVGHIGIYIGNNQFVHASSSTTGVIVSELSGYYENRGFTARRIVGVS